jgi:hypothetical protein
MIGGLGAVAYGLNNEGQVVGTDGNGHNFLWNAGTLSTLNINVPGATAVAVTGINDKGQMSGESDVGGFIYAGGVVSTIAVPGELYENIEVGGINNNGQLVGTYFPKKSDYYTGFLDSKGVFSQISVSGATTSANGINNLGQIVGTGQNGVLFRYGIFYSDGSLTGFEVPGSDSGSTDAYGINDLGQIVGDFVRGGQTHGFLDAGGHFTTIDVPGAASTGIRGINNDGTIVGYYQDSRGSLHAFSAVPSAPQKQLGGTNPDDCPCKLGNPQVGP